MCGLVEGPLAARVPQGDHPRRRRADRDGCAPSSAASWCADREPVLKAYAAGLADAEQERQARAHLAHCRQCSEFVARLSGHLHDLGGAVAAAGAIDGIDGHLGIGDRLADLGDRVGGLVARGGVERRRRRQSPGPAGTRAAPAPRAPGCWPSSLASARPGRSLVACAGGGDGGDGMRRCRRRARSGSAATAADAPAAAKRTSEPRRSAPAPKPPVAARADAAVPGRQRVGPDARRRRDAVLGRRRRRRSDRGAPAAPSRQPERDRRPAEPTVAATAPPTEQEFGVSAAAVAPPSSQPVVVRSGVDRAASTTRRAHRTCARSSGREAGRCIGDRGRHRR